MSSPTRLSYLRSRYAALAARLAAPLPSDTLPAFHPLPRASTGKLASTALAHHERRQLAREVFAYRCQPASLLLMA